MGLEFKMNLNLILYHYPLNETSKSPSEFIEESSNFGLEPDLLVRFDLLLFLLERINKELSTLSSNS